MYISDALYFWLVCELRRVREQTRLEMEGTTGMNPQESLQNRSSGSESAVADTPKMRVMVARVWTVAHLLAEVVSNEGDFPDQLHQRTEQQRNDVSIILVKDRKTG